MFSSIAHKTKFWSFRLSRVKVCQILCRLRTKLCPNFGCSRARLCPISFAPCPFPNLAGTLLSAVGGGSTGFVGLGGTTRCDPPITPRVASVRGAYGAVRTWNVLEFYVQNLRRWKWLNFINQPYKTLNLLMSIFLLRVYIRMRNYVVNDVSKHENIASKRYLECKFRATCGCRIIRRWSRELLTSPLGGAVVREFLCFLSLKVALNSSLIISLKNLEKPWKTLKNLEKPWKTLKNLEKPWKTLKNLEKTLKNLEKPWKTLKNLEKPWIP